MKSPPLWELAIYSGAIALGYISGGCTHAQIGFRAFGDETQLTSEQVGFWCRLITDPTAFFTALTSIIGLGGFAFLYTQLKEVRKTNATATTQAEAAKEMVEVQIAGQRGKLALLEIDAHDRFQPKIRFINIGMTAVVHIDSVLYGRIVSSLPGSEATPHEKVDNNENHCVIKPNEVISTYGKLHGVELTKPYMEPKGDDEMAIIKGSKFLWVRGWIIYDDVFGDRHRLNFAALWNKESRNYTMSGYRAYNQEDYLGQMAEV